MFEEKLKTTKRNLYFLLIAKCLLLSWTVFAQVFNLSSETQITQAQIEAIRNALPRLENDKVFYHWTNIGNGVRWVGDGKVDPGEIAFMNTPTGDRQVYGPGLYLADDPVSSSSFGSLPTSFKISKGTPVYNRDVVLRVLNKKLSNEEASKLGEYIPFVRETDNPGWFVTNSAQNTQDVKYAAYYSPKTVIRDDNLKDSFEVISKLRDNASGGDAEYLKNLVASFEYMDGISVPAAMKTNPEAPWKAFSPEGLDAFERTMNPGFVKWANSSPPVGTNAQIEKLTKIYASLSGGEVKSLDQIVRSEGIRAGGDELGQKFLATEKQLKELLNNPYLEVISEKRSDGLYLVHYFYPDAFHYKNLKEKLSPELFARLSKMNPDELMKNHELRKSLNKEIIQDLLKNLFDHYSGRIPAVSSTDYLEFQRFLISIHPFDDYNGRSVRMFARLQPGGENLHYFFSDMDLLTPIEEQKVMLGDSSEAIVDMRRSLFHEYLKAKSENRMPDYLKTGAFESYMFEAGPEQTYFDYTNKDVVQDIQKRNWPQVFKRAERDHKKNFSYLIAKSSDLPLKHARLKRFFQNAFADKELLRTHIDDYLNFLKLLKNGGEGWAEGDLERLIYVANGTFIKEPTLFTALPKNKQKAVLDLYQNYLTRSLKNHLEGKGATSFYANYDVFYQYYDSFYQEASSEAKLKSIPPSKLKEITEKQATRAVY